MKFSFQVSSVIPAPKSKVWESVSSMSGVNYELGPWVQMTYPTEAERLIDNTPLNKPVFRAKIMLFGLLLVDLHDLEFEHIDYGSGFKENSRTLTHHYWKHARALKEINSDQCQVTDQVEFEPKVWIMGYFIAPIAKALFRWRHRRLANRFK